MKLPNKIYPAIIIFTLIALLLTVFLLYLLGDINHESHKIASDQNGTIFMNEQSLALDDFKKHYQDRKADLEKISQLFVDLENPVNVIKFLEETASNSSLAADINITPSKDHAKNVLPVAAFQISATGDFLNVVAFAQKLETGPYLITIKNITIKKAEQDTKEKNTFQKVDANFLIEAATRP